MNSGPVVPMVWEGLNVVKTGRVMLGETNPAASAPGTIRGDFCIQVKRKKIRKIRHDFEICMPKIIESILQNLLNIIFVFRLDVIFAMVLMLLSLQKKKSLYGSRMKNSSNGILLP